MRECNEIRQRSSVDARGIDKNVVGTQLEKKGNSESPEEPLVDGEEWKVPYKVSSKKLNK